MAKHIYRKHEGVVTVYEPLLQTAYKQQHGNVPLCTSLLFLSPFPLLFPPFSLRTFSQDRKSLPGANSSAWQTIGDFGMTEELSNDRKTIRHFIGSRHTLPVGSLTYLRWYNYENEVPIVIKMFQLLLLLINKFCNPFFTKQLYFVKISYI